MPIISGSTSDLSTISGLTTQPARLIIRERDNNPGRYPSILSTSDPDRRGTTFTPFDATYVINYLSSSSDQTDMGKVQYPTVLLSGYQINKLGPFDQGPAPTGNPPGPPYNKSTYFRNSNLTSTGSILMGVSDSNLDVGFSRGRRNAETGKWIPTKNHWVNDEDPKPFDASRIYLEDNDYYLTGTVGAYESLGQKLGSKVSFKINITSGEERDFTRSPKSRFNSLDAAGEFHNQDVTGFCYYNFKTKRWDQIGLTDPATGEPILFDWAVELRGGPSKNTSDQINFHSGTNNWPQQFKASNHGTPNTELGKQQQGYNRIGTPTVSCLAPFSTKYYATSSQALQMSDYINHPFLLEKVVVDLPIRAQRKHRFKEADGNRSRTESRDQDDYVFFIYRQTHRPSPSSPKDSHYDISGSDRFIVCSGTMTFFNNVIRDGNNTLRVDFSPVNNPAFSHDFNMPVPPAASNSSVEFTGSFTGSVRLKLEPAVAAAQYHGLFKVPNAGADPGGSGRPQDKSQGFVKMKNYWPGGTSAKAFLQEQSITKQGKVVPLASRYTGRVGISASYGSPAFDKYESFASVSKTRSDLPIELIDPRAFKSVGGDTEPKENAFGVSIGSDTSKISPYLLFPEDEIIFGVDSVLGIVGVDNSFSSSFSNRITGSKMTIEASPASVTFFGTLLRDQKPVPLLSTNPQLTSPAVHQAIQQDMTIVDQYDIERSEIYSGTYIDEVYGGGAIRAYSPDEEHARLSQTRGTVGSVAGGTAGITGSLLRAVRISDSTEQYWDTVMPDKLEYGTRVDTLMYFYDKGVHSSVSGLPEMPDNRIAFEEVGTQASGAMTISHIRTGSILSEATCSMPYPYEGNPTRNPQDSRNVSLGILPAPLFGLTVSGAFIHNYSNRHTKIPDHIDAVNRVLFSAGWETQIEGRTSSATIGFIKHRTAGGATAMKYGVKNYMPNFTSAVFRRDHYGQFRDMLEPRKFAKFYKLGQKDGSMSPVEVRFVQRLTDQTMDPRNIVQKEKDSGTSNDYGSQVKKPTQSRNISLISSCSRPYFDSDRKTKSNGSN
jgi:hypothetical protein